MRKKLVLLMMGVMLLGAITGCDTSKSTESTKSPPNIDAQVKIINTYMEALTSQDKEKLVSVMSRRSAGTKITDESLNQLLSTQENLGTLQKFVILKETAYVDENNGQTIVEARAFYPEMIYQLEFDLRKTSGKWEVLAANTISQAKNKK